MYYKFLKRIYRSKVYMRIVPDEATFYFSAEDFPGLTVSPYELTSSDGHSLAGYFYSYEGCDHSRIVILEHGMGPGHVSYMPEIEMLAAHGYLVFTYDHTGCRESGGENIGGFIQSLKDLDDVITTLKADKEYSGRKISVIGHSWGGFSTLNIAAWHPDITHAVAISGFTSVKSIIDQYFRKFSFGVAKRLYLEECEKNREYVETNAATVLKTSPVKTMIIHSKGDKKVNFGMHFDALRREIGQKSGIIFVEMSDREHNPTYTRDAIIYKKAFYKARRRAHKRGELKTKEGCDLFRASFDWRKMTEQDTELWKKIFNFLDDLDETEK